jgi:predicted hydrolase (HD superfamily)
MTQEEKESFEWTARHWAEDEEGRLREDLLADWDWQSQPTKGVLAGMLPPTR